MNDDLINASLSVQDKQAIMEAVHTIKDKLPFLIDLSKEDRRYLPKMGDKSRAFVDKAMEVATNNVEILPRSFDLKEFERDIKLFSDLNSILITVSQLNELIDDTAIAAGSDAYRASLEVYAYAKIARKGAGLDELKATMSKRFISKNKSKDASAEATV